MLFDCFFLFLFDVPAYLPKYQKTSQNILRENTLTVLSNNGYISYEVFFNPTTNLKRENVHNHPLCV